MKIDVNNYFEYYDPNNSNLYLNGEVVKLCFEFDIEAGYVKHYLSNNKGIVLIDGVAVEQTSYGEVTVKEGEYNDR